MNLNDFTQYFDNPAVSIFDRSQSKKLPVDIGPLYPLKWDLLSFGNSAKGNSAHSLRMNPMVVPTYTNMKLSEHTAIVPLRTIMSDYEAKFNYATNPEGASLPSLTFEEYQSILHAMLIAGISPIGSLFDYLGFPVFGDLFSSIDFEGFKMSNSNGDTSSFASVPYNYFFDGSTRLSTNSFGLNSYRDFSQNIYIVPFVVFLAYKTYQPTLTYNTYYQTYMADTNLVDYMVLCMASGNNLSDAPSDDQLIGASIFSTMQSAVEAYQNYIFSQCIYYYTMASVESDQPYTTLPLRAYFRFHYDWNTNGNFTDRDLLLENFVYNYDGFLKDYANAINNGQATDEIISYFKFLVLPVNRLWNDDFFTSLLPTSAVDNAVEIPANSTVLDLAKLTAWQKFVMKLSYSSRYRDVVWNIFKIKPSDARLQQSYPIFRKYHNIGVGETIQTSSDSAAGVLGSFAGRAYSSGKTKGYHIFCEEPCVLLDFVSITPEAVYADALHPLIHVDDILDFPIPDMDVLGNQPIMADMVSGNPADSSVVLGYGRQYQEWLGNYNTVHGDYKTTLDYWVLTRRFEDTPVINDDFLRIHPADDLDKIFAVPSAPHANLDIYYNARVTRHVHRNVRIKI